MDIIILPLIILFSSALADLIVLGYFLSDKKWFNLVESMLQTSTLNKFDSSIISVNGTFITNISFPITCKYYISGEGRIPRWSKMHKLIKNKHKELLLANFKK